MRKVKRVDEPASNIAALLRSEAAPPPAPPQMKALNANSRKKCNLAQKQTAKKEIEYWDPNCVDKFELYWSKELTKTETDELTLIRSQIFSTATPEEEVPNLYREAVAILHGAWCRTQKNKKCVLRDATEEESEMGRGFYGVSEAT
jgi:hypothetical protein